MALVHNCIIRALNSIYLQAPHIQPSDHKSFIAYCLAAHDGLQAHHDGEEEFFFPKIEHITGRKGLMDGNVQQHEAFHSGFHAWGQWLQDARSGKTEFDGEKCVALMDAFVAPLSTHLADEIPTLLALSQFGASLDLKSLSKAEGDKVMGGLSKTAQLPIFFVNHDETFEGGIHSFPPIPPPVKWVLRQCGRWNADWWKFGSVGFDGFPRELRFRGE
ncbi:hypothetical protein CC78DRAFT_536757 [Lojkania enalia]|uniref:Hemerythrin-like domain-containing protein n=1 Tax=Lojkania enalia TaxID=147567 RepID=A0A9P4MZX3_9PLEO|nr:hypothetical protein CC78DRAFT_536757 [Didymosphaeria enalia]